MSRRKNSLPAGLPACISAGKSALDRLQSLLELANRKEWHSILKASVSKYYLQLESLQLRGLSTSQRVARKAIALYSRPEARREFWETKTLGLAIVLDGERDCLPSLEHSALKRFDQGFLDREVDSDLLEETLGDIVGFRYSPFLPELEGPALAVWPDLRRDLLAWGALPSDRQEAVVLATFAVASILDDVRLLEWAAKKSERLALEFAFAVPSPGESDSGPVQPQPTGSPEPISGIDGVLEEWNRSCALIIEAATLLKSSSPDPRRLGDLRGPVKRLEALQAHVVAAIEARDRKALVSRMSEILAACANDFEAQWLKEIRDRVHAQWQLVYRSPNAVSDTQVRRDLARMEDELAGELRRWRKAEDSKAQCRKELSKLGDPQGSDLESQLLFEAREQRLHERMAKAAREATDGKRRILEVIAPEGSQFEPARDYEAELARAERPAGNVKATAANASVPNDSAKPGTDSDSGGDGSDSIGGPRLESRLDGACAGPASGEAPGAGTRHEAASADLTGSGASTNDTRPDKPTRREKTGAVIDGETAQPGTKVEQVTDCRWTGTWNGWLERIGDWSHQDSVASWGDAHVPECPAQSPFTDPVGFAKALGRKLAQGMIAQPTDALRALVEYVDSDPARGRQEWKQVYRVILDYCLRQDLDDEDCQAMTLSLITLMLGANPSETEYVHLIDTADHLTALPPAFKNVKWALEVSAPFLEQDFANREHLTLFLSKIDHFVSSAGFHLASRHLRHWSEIKEFVNASSQILNQERAASESSRELQQLSCFLKEKTIVIYTLQRAAALAARDRISAIESTTTIRLLHDKVWSASLRDPIRNADICVMVKSAATHAVTEMIARTRSGAGKELIVPPWKGVHSLLRAVCDAAGVGEFALAPGLIAAGSLS